MATTQGTQHTPHTTIVADGMVRLRRAVAPEISREVEARYAERMAKASVWRRVTLLRQMRREIDQRVAERASIDSLY
jgi:hypothetical protein